MSAVALNLNHYAPKKSVVESMLDVALLLANASLLMVVIEQGPGFNSEGLNDVGNQSNLNIQSNVGTGLVFFTVIFNTFITAFGVQKTGL
ncbi:NINJ1 protein, partial [Polyodon spathula]|nr:NINJ1 protein [Polyodon spathula]